MNKERETEQKNHPYEKEIKLGSLFDGIGVFPLAASRFGVTPVWASEIKKAPASITRKQFPHMRQLGDIRKVRGNQIEAVHVITFGSPCQDLSAIGAHGGLTGKQSGLFFEAMRIIDEMRDQSHGIYPTFAVWENVMGAFSSNHRLDFKAVLEAFTATKIPMPPSGRWANAGLVRGGVPDISWRVLDAQYWEAPDCAKEESASFSWQILEEHAAQKYYLNPAGCSRILYLAQMAGTLPPKEIETILRKQGGVIPSSEPFMAEKMRQAAKEGDVGMFLQSFGDSTHAFPTLLASDPVLFAIWQEGNEAEGCIRYLTPLECERLMGLPDGWTAYGSEGDAISDRARYEALGNAVALPCADYIMAGIREVLADR